MSSNKKLAYWDCIVHKTLDDLGLVLRDSEDEEGAEISDVSRASFVASLSDANSKIKMALWLDEKGIKNDDDDKMEYLGGFIREKSSIDDLLD